MNDSRINRLSSDTFFCVVFVEYVTACQAVNVLIFLVGILVVTPDITAVDLRIAANTLVFDTVWDITSIITVRDYYVSFKGK